MNQTFELFLSGTDILYRYKVRVPVLNGRTRLPLTGGGWRHVFRRANHLTVVIDDVNENRVVLLKRWGIGSNREPDVELNRHA